MAFQFATSTLSWPFHTIADQHHGRPRDRVVSVFAKLAGKEAFFFVKGRFVLPVTSSLLSFGVHRVPRGVQGSQPEDGAKPTWLTRLCPKGGDTTRCGARPGAK